MISLLKIKQELDHFVNTLGREPKNLTVLMTEIAFEEIKIQMRKVCGAEIGLKGLILWGAEVIVIRPPRTETPIAWFTITEVVR